MSHHDSALLLEAAARRALDLYETSGLGGVLQADFIEKSRCGFTVICAALSPYYMNSNFSQRLQIDAFVDKYKYLFDPNLPEDQYFDGVNRAAWQLNSFLSTFMED